MRVDVCPAAVIQTPPDRVWEALTDPTGFSMWTDAVLVRAIPPGRATSGQKLELRARGLGRSWPVEIDVLDLDPPKRLNLEVRLPLGIVNHEVITLTPAGDGGTLVRFN